MRTRLLFLTMHTLFLTWNKVCILIYFTKTVHTCLGFFLNAVSFPPGGCLKDGGSPPLSFFLSFFHIVQLQSVGLGYCSIMTGKSEAGQGMTDL